MAINKVTLDGNDLIDLTQDTVTEQDVASGKTFHSADGEQRVGEQAPPQLYAHTIIFSPTSSATTKINAYCTIYHSSAAQLDDSTLRNIVFNNNIYAASGNAYITSNMQILNVTYISPTWIFGVMSSSGNYSTVTAAATIVSVVDRVVTSTSII